MPERPTPAVNGHEVGSPALQASRSISSFEPAARTVVSCASIAMDGSFCLFWAKGLGGLPTDTRVSLPRAVAEIPGSSMEASNEIVAARKARRFQPIPTPFECHLGVETATPSSLWAPDADPSLGTGDFATAQSGQTKLSGGRFWGHSARADRLRSAAGKGPADHDPLDLRGALEDRVDLGVPVPLLHREVLDVAVASQDLHGLLGDPHRHLARLELRHGPLGPLEVTVASQPRG